MIHNMNEEERLEWEKDERDVAKYLGEIMVVEEIEDFEDEYEDDQDTKDLPE